MTYPPPGNDPYGQQPPAQPQPAAYDPYAAPVQQPVQPTYDPYAAAPNPYAQPPVAPGYGTPGYGTPGYDATGYGMTSGVPAGYTSPYGPAYGQIPTAKTNGMSIASMVLGICGLLFCFCYGLGLLPGAVGAILGHVSMRQIKERGEQGRGMALAGVITGWISVALVILGWGLVIVMIASDPNFQRDFNSSF